MQTTSVPVTWVIFGASGDLTHRKIIPALFSLFLKGRLDFPFQVVGFAMDDWNDEALRARLREGIEPFVEPEFHEDDWRRFSERVFFQQGNFTEPADYDRLTARLGTLEAPATGRVFYLATPPQFFGPIALQLGRVGLLDERAGWRRLVVEKPFGTSYETARALNETLHSVLKEEQIFRIDHYLGKETVQNLLVLRFANTFFEPVWSNRFIDHVQISVLEEVGVGHRAGYYDKSGVLRDMFQNHLMQLLTLTALEPPASFRPEDLQERKMEVLRALRPIQPDDVAEHTVRGQYRGYLQEPGVAPSSQTPTYAALRLFIDTPRWKGVPFLLRSGKSMNRKCTEIVLQFSCPPWAVPPLPPGEEIEPNLLSICIQPGEGVYLKFEAKVPDTEADTRPVEMEFHYNDSFGPGSIPEAYERLILEILQGDHSLFVRDMVTESSWHFFDRILAGWESPSAPALQIYEPSSWGPAEADRLLGKGGRSWQVTCGSH